MKKPCRKCHHHTPCSDTKGSGWCQESPPQVLVIGDNYLTTYPKVINDAPACGKFRTKIMGEEN
jgi:hypothetical protein